MIDEKIISDCEKKLIPQFQKLERLSVFNTEKVLNAFRENQVALRHFNPSTGYGYGDESRDTLCRLFASVFKAEKAVVSPHIVSGTHALSLCLFGLLRPGDAFVSITGEPYDTMKDVISGQNTGSLRDFGIGFSKINLTDKGEIDYLSVKNHLSANINIKLVYIQRSRGYEWRNALSIDEIEKVCRQLKTDFPDVCVMVDNCYGEFVQEKEPIEAGADVSAGSLIKNIGGGLAPTGGYIVGKEKYIVSIENRLTAPSLGGEVGSYEGNYRNFYQGLFLAPHTVKEALMGSLLFGSVFKSLGYETSPDVNSEQFDVTRSIKMGDESKLVAFIQSIQRVSPIDAFVTPLPWDMPGYENKVIMAAGCFVQGASIELSADAPVKEPYIAYIQGGLTYEHCKIALKNMNL